MLKKDDIERRTLLQSALAAALVGAGSSTLTRPVSAGVEGVSYLGEAVLPRNMDTVMWWTDMMIQHIRDAALPPKRSARALAMGHLAGFLAMNGIGRRYADTYGIGAGPQNANMIAAYHVATAHALEEAFQQPIRFKLRDRLSRIPAGEAKSKGVEWGRVVGKKIARMRAKDNSDDTKATFYRGRYQPRSHILKWEPTLPHFDSGVGPRLEPYDRGLLPAWGYVKPFGVSDIRPYRATRFMHPQSQAMADDFNKIRRLGAHNSTIRTDDQTEIAFFWEDGPPGGTPSGHFLVIAAQLFQERFDTYELARNMALVSMSQADAGIAAWDSKYHYDIMRPETAIRKRGNGFGNTSPRVRQQPNWKALILTPQFPAYVSGHSTFGAAGMRMIWNCLGTNDITYTLRPIDLAWWPEQLKGVTRRHTSLWQAAEDNGLSRLYGGVHWTPDHTEGMRIGRELADATFRNHFPRI